MTKTIESYNNKGDTINTSRVFSGVQPSGNLHIGNYIGALRQWSKLIETRDCLFCIVDLHALTSTTKDTSSDVQTRAKDVAALYIACGIDPHRSTIFVQSDVSAHSTLMWYLTCITPVGALERMTQFKSKTANTREVNAGLLMYPVLMAADILLYDADTVPVGDDQKQHIELARDLAQKFNHLYGATLQMPRPEIPSSGARVMGLDDPTKKMSKTDALSSSNHAIGILDPPHVIKKKIARAVTDGGRSVSLEGNSPGVENLIDIYSALRELPNSAVTEQMAGMTYGQLKDAVSLELVATLEPIQREYEKIRSDEKLLQYTLDQGALRAREIAAQTIARVERALGI